MVTETNREVKQFAINRYVKCRIGPALAAKFPHWRLFDISADNDTLYIYAETTEADVQTVQSIIDGLRTRQKAPRPVASTFAWMQGRAAKAWQRALRQREVVR